MIRITLKTPMIIPGLETDPATLPDDVNTVRELLRYISGRINVDILGGKSDSLQDAFEIILNDKNVWFSPGGLDARLTNNDSVEIRIVGLGGG